MGIFNRSMFSVKLLNHVVGGHSSFGCNITELSINSTLSGVNGHLQHSFLQRTGNRKVFKNALPPQRLVFCALSEPALKPRSRRRAKTEALDSTHVNVVWQKRRPVSIQCLGASQQLNNANISHKTHIHTCFLCQDHAKLAQKPTSY